MTSSDMKELTQFSGIDVRDYWQEVMKGILEKYGTGEQPEKTGLSKEWFLEIAESVFPKWKEQRRTYLVMFIMGNIHEKSIQGRLHNLSNLFDSFSKVRVLERKDGSVFTELSVMKGQFFSRKD